MADPRFFTCNGPYKLADIAQRLGLDLQGDPELVIDDVAPLDTAGGSHLSFLDNVKYKEHFTKSKAGACVIHPEMAQYAPEGMALLAGKSPYKAYALAAQMFYPFEKADGNISPQAFVHPEAHIGEGCQIESFAVIEEGVHIGDHCIVEGGAVIQKNVEMGANCRIGANATLSHCILGDHVRLYPGVRVGQDGFGFAIDPAGFVKVPQLGRVIIEDHVEIGANTTIDRGAGPDTVIGQGTWIDNLVQIGHNVKIGKGCILVSQVGISGSTVLEDYVAVGGQVGIAGHLHIGQGVRIGAQAGVMKNISAGEEHMGSPSMPSKQFMRQVATLKRLINSKKSA